MNEEETEKQIDLHRLVKIASACLLSFAIIRGDTGKMLRAVSTILVSKHSTSFEMVVSIVFFGKIGAGNEDGTFLC